MHLLETAWSRSIFSGSGSSKKVRLRPAPAPQHCVQATACPALFLQLRYFNAIYVLQEVRCGASITTHSMNEPTGDEPQYEDSTL
jgi:hypothetical protein